MADNVNHPAHYQSKKGIETIDIIEACVEDLTGIEAVCTGNVIKYISRWKKKNGLEDLKKAQWYLNKLIDTASDTINLPKTRSISQIVVPDPLEPQKYNYYNVNPSIKITSTGEITNETDKDI